MFTLQSLCWRTSCRFWLTARGLQEGPVLALPPDHFGASGGHSIRAMTATRRPSLTSPRPIEWIQKGAAKLLWSPFRCPPTSLVRAPFDWSPTFNLGMAQKNDFLTRLQCRLLTSQSQVHIDTPATVQPLPVDSLENHMFNGAWVSISSDASS